MISWFKFAQKKYFQSKTENVNTTIDFYVLVQVPNSTWTDNSDFLDQIYSKREFPVENRKKEHHHSILNIEIIVDTKFWLNWHFLNFSTKFSKSFLYTIGLCNSSDKWSNLVHLTQTIKKIHKKEIIVTNIFILIKFPTFSFFIFYFFFVLKGLIYKIKICSSLRQIIKIQKNSLHSAF